MAITAQSSTRTHSSVKVTNVSGPTVFGIHFTDPDSGALHGLTCLRWTEHLTLDTYLPDLKRWESITVAAPERFTLGQDVNTAKQWRAVVARWFTASERPTVLDGDPL